MKNQIWWAGLLLCVLAFLVFVVLVKFFSVKPTEVPEIIAQEGPEVITVAGSESTSKPSCLVITSPTLDSEVTLPLEVVGYIDLAGAEAGACSHWTAFEGIAGRVELRNSSDTTNPRSTNENLILEGEYVVGMDKWPVSATLHDRVDSSYFGEVNLFFVDDNPRGDIFVNSRSFKLNLIPAIQTQ